MKPEMLAEKIRAACAQAALEAYENAGMQGLCAEGRWEAAIDALQTFDLAPVLREFQQVSEGAVGARKEKRKTIRPLRKSRK